MRKYETIFVIDSLLKSEEIDNIVGKYERFISANGGTIEDIEHWGKKRLAYEIKKRQYGYYVLIRFDGPPSMIKPLEREYRLNESLLRYKTLVMEKASLEAVERVAAQPPKAEEKADKTETPAVTVAEDSPAVEETETVEEATEETPDVNEEEDAKDE